MERGSIEVEGLPRVADSLLAGAEGAEVIRSRGGVGSEGHGDADGFSGLLSPGSVLVEFEDFLVGGGDYDDAANLVPVYTCTYSFKK